MTDKLISCSVSNSTFFTAAVKGRSHIVNNMVRRNRFELFTDNIAVYNLKRSYPLNVWCKHRCNGYPFIFHSFVFAFRVYGYNELTLDFSRIIFVRTKPSIKGECEYDLVFCVRIGELVKKREYSTKRGERRTRYGNTFFDEYFGMSDFQEVNPILLKRGGTSRYLVKYIMKSGEKALYSRGTPAEICKELSENDEVGSYFDYVTKYVLWDDVLDWERDIKDYGKKKRLHL